MRISIFIDGQNFFKLQRDILHWTVDLNAFLKYFQQLGDVIDAFYYTSVKYPTTETQKRFLDILPVNGYVAITKPLKKHGPSLKGNMDVEIVLDMFNTVDSYDMAILVSGDGDFERALNLLRARGKRFIVVSTDEMIAREIRLISGMHYIDIKNIKEYVWLKDTNQYSADEVVESFSD